MAPPRDCKKGGEDALEDQLILISQVRILVRFLKAADESYRKEESPSDQEHLQEDLKEDEALFVHPREGDEELVAQVENGPAKSQNPYSPQHLLLSLLEVQNLFAVICIILWCGLLVNKQVLIERRLLFRLDGVIGGSIVQTLHGLVSLYDIVEGHPFIDLGDEHKVDHDSEADAGERVHDFDRGELDERVLALAIEDPWVLLVQK
eukprot:CAMPEP_0168608918 /NCGR_PEP_ID=MMETSP0449_2-20121227/909_1 /TAXON_ID=1082188 /ORGANISM="Strombidium rassoulzadegani, Strain ras09" /LENGTH=205 /DNA_ID=CAMNT_0008648987 /DNA_START=287 /DNA_END=903 /DNA_ORIENTATION=-